MATQNTTGHNKEQETRADEETGGRAAVLASPRLPSASCCALWCSSWLLLCLPAEAAAAERATTVGLAGRIVGLVIPGGEVQARPLTDRRSPIVLRVVRAEPVEGGFRYELEYQGLEAGTFDLKNYLRRKDPDSIARLPSIPVTIRSVLPPGQVLPHELEPAATPWLGGYRALLIGGGVLWAVGLAAILFVGRRRKRSEAPVVPPVTLADRLRPLVEAAMAGRSEPERLAELERMLILYWSRRLGLAAARPVEALARLRGDPQAGPLLDQLEIWLHRPARASTIDVPSLLAPYRDLPADALEVEARAS